MQCVFCNRKPQIGVQFLFFGSRPGYMRVCLECYFTHYDGTNEEYTKLFVIHLPEYQDH
jgi:hypothetical protein